jgi:hypothetical protein
MVKMYVYTEKGEEIARRLNLEERKAGTQALAGGEPLRGGPTAQEWLKRGYVAYADFSKHKEWLTNLNNKAEA